MTYADLFLRIRRKLNDQGPTYRWPDLALRMYAGTILRRMAEVAPYSCASVAEVTLVEGSLQPIPVFAVRFLGAVRRSGDNRSIRNVSPEVMDTVLPGWRDHPESDLITDCVYDMAVPTEFSVYPPAEAGAKIWARVSLRAADPIEETELIPVNQVHEMALLHGILALCFSEDTDAGDMQLSASHWGQFYDALGVQRSVDAQNTPAAKEDQG